MAPVLLLRDTVPEAAEAVALNVGTKIQFVEPGSCPVILNSQPLPSISQLLITAASGQVHRTRLTRLGGIYRPPSTSLNPSALQLDEHRALEPPNSLRQSLIDVFPAKPPVVDRLLSLLGPMRSRYQPLNLNGCAETTSGVLACGTHLQGILEHEEAWNSQYRAYAYQPPSVAFESEKQVTFVRGLLVGVIDSDANGSVYISGDCWSASGRLVIAPPPDSRLRHAPVWIRDWRYIPSTCGPGVFEVLAKDITLLTAEAQDITRFCAVGTDLVASRRAENVRGFVRAKSCIIASKSPKPCFLVELAEVPNVDGCSAVIIVFRGRDAMKWWPFLWVGQDVGVTGLKVSHLPRYSNRVVLKAQSPISSCYSLHCVEDSEIPCLGSGRAARVRHEVKKRRVDPSCAKNVVSQLHEAQSLITYEGQITGVLPGGKFQLDHKVLLYVGDFRDSCAGPGVVDISFREGTRIVASWVAFTIRGGQLCLFPTGRTSVALQYFGELSGCSKQTNTQNNVWRWIWKRWHFADIIWADDLFCSLHSKFGLWLLEAPDSGAAEMPADADLVRYLLGTRTSTGLVQFSMSLLSGRKDLLDTDLTPSRDLYLEFLSPHRVPEVSIARPSAPCLLAVSEATQHLWRKYARGCLEDKKRSELGAIDSHTQVVFQDFQILEALRSENCKVSVVQLGLEQGTIVLFGLLQGASGADRKTILSDASASMSARAIGHVPLFAFESIVAIHRFWVVAEATSLAYSCQITLIFDASSIQEVVACASSSKFGISDSRRTSRISGQLPRWSGMSPLVFTSNSPSMKRRIVPSQRGSTFASTVAECPLICIFVERLTPACKAFVITGYLVALCRSPKRAQWIPLALNDKQLCLCSLALSGQSVLRFTSGLHLGSLYAVSCSELRLASNPEQYLQRKITASFRHKFPLELVTHFESGVPFVRNLGHGEDMRFCAPNDDLLYYRKFAPGYAMEGGQDRQGVAVNGECSAVLMAIEELFKKETMNAVVTSLWRAFSFSELESEENVVSLRGTVQRCGQQPEHFASDGCSTPWQLCIRDEQVEVFQITVDFYDYRFIPQGLVPGMVVVVHNVSRVPLQTGSRFRFVGSVATFLDLVSIPMPNQNAECLNCTNPLPAPTAIASFKYATLWEFSAWNETEKKRSCEAGVVRFRIMRIEYLEAKTTKHVGCFKCGVGENTDDKLLNIAVSVVATIEDGSAVGTLSCKGFRAVTKLLSANQKERWALKSMCLREGGFEISREAAESNLRNPGHERRPNKCFSAICGMICRKRDDRVVALAMNQSRLGLSETSSIDHNAEVLMKSFRLGFGRVLWTSYSRKSAVVIECLAVYDRLPTDRRSTDSDMTAESTLRHLLKEYS